MMSNQLSFKPIALGPITPQIAPLQIPQLIVAYSGEVEQ